MTYRLEFRIQHPDKPWTPWQMCSPRLCDYPSLDKPQEIVRTFHLTNFDLSYLTQYRLVDNEMDLEVWREPDPVSPNQLAKELALLKAASVVTSVAPLSD